GQGGLVDSSGSKPVIHKTANQMLKVFMPSARVNLVTQCVGQTGDCEARWKPNNYWNLRCSNLFGRAELIPPDNPMKYARWLPQPQQIMTLEVCRRRCPCSMIWRPPSRPCLTPSQVLGLYNPCSMIRKSKKSGSTL